ncbi:hypothetical protein DRP05_10220 [Archaeoglobales archaeon]|nr:MAG: hypothetical protein DRP05_10220 [Archaeoglobales archaeon]
MDRSNKVKHYIEKFVVVKRGTSLYEAFMKMYKNNAKVAVVVNKKPVGIVTTHTILERIIN